VVVQHENAALRQAQARVCKDADVIRRKSFVFCRKGERKAAVQRDLLKQAEAQLKSQGDYIARLEARVLALGSHTQGGNRAPMFIRPRTSMTDVRMAVREMAHVSVPHAVAELSAANVPSLLNRTIETTLNDASQPPAALPAQQARSSPVKKHATQTRSEDENSFGCAPQPEGRHQNPNTPHLPLPHPSPTPHAYPTHPLGEFTIESALPGNEFVRSPDAHGIGGGGGGEANHFDFDFGFGCGEWFASPHKGLAGSEELEGPDSACVSVGRAQRKGVQGLLQECSFGEGWISTSGRAEGKEEVCDEGKEVDCDAEQKELGAQVKELASAEQLTGKVEEEEQGLDVEGACTKNLKRARAGRGGGCPVITASLQRPSAGASADREGWAHGDGANLEQETTARAQEARGKGTLTPSKVQVCLAVACPFPLSLSLCWLPSRSHRHVLALAPQLRLYPCECVARGVCHPSASLPSPCFSPPLSDFSCLPPTASVPRV